MLIENDYEAEGSRRWIEVSVPRKKMAKRSFASEIATCSKHAGSALNSAQSPPLRSEGEGLDFPADILDFCHFLQFDEGEDGELLADNALPDVERSLHRKNPKIRALKAEKRALQHDLARSRRVGCELEADVARMQQQRQDELVHSNRERQELRRREQAVQARELASTRLKEDFARLQERLTADVHQHQQDEVRALLSDMVERVALASRVQSKQVELTWSNWLQQDTVESAADLTKQWRETEELVDVEQELQRVHMLRLGTQLEEFQERRLQSEAERIEMEAKWTALRQEALSLSSWANVMAFRNVELTRRLRVEIDRMRESETALRAELAQQQKDLRAAQLGELKGQQQLRATQQAMKEVRRQRQELKNELKLLKARHQVQDARDTQAHGHLEAALKQMRA